MTDLKSLGLDDWLSRAAAVKPRTDAFILNCAVASAMRLHAGQSPCQVSAGPSMR